MGYPYASGAPSSLVRHKRTVRAGVCRFCGCGTKGKRSCVLTRSLFGGPPQVCGWADPTKTLCTAPACLRAEIREKRAAAKARP